MLQTTKREPGRLELEARFAPLRIQLEAFAVNVLKDSAETTRNVYVYSLERFFDYLYREHRDTFPSFDEGSVNAFFRELLESEGRSRIYIHKLYSAIAAFSKYLDKPLNKSNVFEDIHPKGRIEGRLERIEARLYRDYVTVLQDRNADLKLGKLRDKLRNYLIFRVVASTGLSLEEVLEWNLSDVDGPLCSAHPELQGLLKEYRRFRLDNDQRIYYLKLQRQEAQGRLPEPVHRAIREEIALAAVPPLREPDQAYDMLLEMALLRYTERNFQFNPALFVSNRYKRVSKDAIVDAFKLVGFYSSRL